MEDKFVKSLNKVIEEKIEEYSKYPETNDKRSATLKEVAELHKMRVEEAKIELEEYQARKKAENEQQALISEDAYKYESMKSQRNLKLLELAKDVSLGVGGFVAYTIWQRREQIFEMTGTPSSGMFRNLLNKMLPKI